MNIYTWPTNVNTKFYAYSERPKENTTTATNLSGRQVAIQNNTKDIMTYSFNVELTKTELTAFWDWFNNTLGQVAGAFTCSAIGSSYYRFTSIPEVQNSDQIYKQLSMEIEEIF